MVTSVHRCDYGNEYGECGKRGTRVELPTLLTVGYYCREHTAWLAERGESWCVAE